MRPVRRKIFAHLDPLIAALRARRTALGLTQLDIARLIGYSLSAVETWEEGRAQPKTSAVLAYAAAVDARIDLVPCTPEPLRITDSVVGLKADHNDSARLSRVGLSASQIAVAHGCSQRTVQRHRARAREEAKSA